MKTVSINEIVSTNKKAYESLAIQFKNKVKIRKKNSGIAVNFFIKHFNNKLIKTLSNLVRVRDMFAGFLSKKDLKPRPSNFHPKWLLYAKKQVLKRKLLLMNF